MLIYQRVSLDVEISMFLSIYHDLSIDLSIDLYVIIYACIHRIVYPSLSMFECISNLERLDAFQGMIKQLATVCPKIGGPKTFHSFSFCKEYYVGGIHMWNPDYIFFHNIWDNPSHWLIFFVETTNQICKVSHYPNAFVWELLIIGFLT